MMTVAPHKKIVADSAPNDFSCPFLTHMHQHMQWACYADGFGNRPTVAVACSGGADSVALLVALHHLTQLDDTVLSGGRVVALTVNHGLRDTAGQDCDFVADLAKQLGIDYHILHWHHNENKVATGIQEKARHARYDLLSDWCHKNGVLHLCTGHHRGDQIETVIMRQNAGSGAYGLAGMATVAYHPWGRVLRPMLGVDKTQCESFLRTQGIGWVHDPSNNNQNFERVRIRRHMTVTQQSESLSLAEQSAHYRCAMDKRMGALLPRCQIFASGCVAVPLSVIQNLSPHDRREWCVRLVSAVGGLHYRMGAKDIAPLMDALQDYFANSDCNADFRGISVGGCDITVWQNRFWIVRSWGVVKSMPVNMQNGQSALMGLWDNKFDSITIPVSHDETMDPAQQENAELGVLGKKGWQTLAPLLEGDMRAQIRARLPLCAIYGLPTVRQNSQIMAVQGLYNADLLKINWHMTRKITPDPFSFGI